MLNDNLVSLIIPFYNGQEYLDRCLQSVLKQTYSNIQLILVDDGSQDESSEIVERYKPRLTDKISELVYLRQQNEGAASAVNAALKYVKGEFLCWADCDDELLPDNILNKYSFLKNNKEYGLVNCGAKAIDQESGNVISELVLPKSKRQDNMFLQIIHGIPVYPGVFMVRTKLLFDKLHNREIYYNREAGQNYQLLLPVAYDNRCGFIDDILYAYYVRNNSHSHNADYDKLYQRTYIRETLLNNVLDFIPQEEKKKIMMDVHCECTMQRFNMSFNNGDIEKCNLSYNELDVRACSMKIKAKHAIINNRILNAIYRMTR